MDDKQQRHMIDKNMEAAFNQTKPKYAMQRIPDDANKIKKMHIDDTNFADVQRLQFDKTKEISVVRVALLKDGTLYATYGNARPWFLRTVARELKDDAEDDGRDDGDDDD